MTETCPRGTSVRTKVEPMNPAPPVTTYFLAGFSKVAIYFPVYRATTTRDSPFHGSSMSMRRSSHTDLSHSFSAGRLMRDLPRTREENHHPSVPILLI